ncbi:MAG: GGDEF domain-containing protein [candidate division Zixibacteria bacterium]|nr:GGDEF domain-containing protein [candidate division Zixibacteria bacterium]
MRLLDQTLMEQMRIDELDIDRRKRLLGITARDVELLAGCKEFIRQNTERIAAAFYDVLAANDDMAVLIGDADTLRRMHRTMKQYLVELFGGFYDAAYVNNRLRVGMVHRRIGVESNQYLTAVWNLKTILQNHLERFVEEDSGRDELFAALEKILHFDTQLVIDAYIRSLMSQVEIAREKTEGYARHLEKKVAERTRELEELSRRDGLTGLYNKRSFQEFLRRDLALAERNKTPLSLVYFDVDRFKHINDAFGHQKGDDVLRNIGAILLSLSRETDIPCRFGGDEFCVILPNTAESEAARYCDRIQKDFTRRFAAFSLSIGIVQTGPDMFDDMDILIDRADRAMYDVKKQVSSPASV